MVGAIWVVGGLAFDSFPTSKLPSFPKNPEEIGFWDKGA